MITHYCYHFSLFDIQKSRRMTQVARTGGKTSKNAKKWAVFESKVSILSKDFTWCNINCTKTAPRILAWKGGLRPLSKGVESIIKRKLLKSVFNT